MKRKLVKKLVSVLLLVVFVVSLGGNALALTTAQKILRVFWNYSGQYAYKLSGGVASRYYWVDTSAVMYNTLIANAMSSWNNTPSSYGFTTTIWINKTTNKSSSIMDIYYQSPVGNNRQGVLAETEYYKGAGASSSVAYPYSEN